MEKAPDNRIETDVRRGRTAGHLRQRIRRSFFARGIGVPFVRRLRIDETSGWPVIGAAVLALIWANSPWSASYESFWSTPVALSIGALRGSIPLRDTVDLFLLPFFFFIITVEIREELKGGHLAGGGRASLPLVAALGGMLVPAGIYLLLTRGGPYTPGFGVPVATDIAFALAALLVLGDRVPPALKAFLLAFAAIDDVGGILVIALVYGHGISWPWLATAAGIALVIALVARARAEPSWIWLVLGVALWLAMIPSGIHVTIAGVVLGALLPATPLFASDEISDGMKKLSLSLDRDVLPRDAILGEMEELARRTEAPSERFSRVLRPWVSYAVLPIFGLSMAGTTIDHTALVDAATHPAALATGVALMLGKPVGVLAATWIAVRLGLTTLPAALTWRHILGIAMLAGIGFTVSLFTAKLAFEPAVLPHVRIAILVASLCAAGAGLAILRGAQRREPHGKRQAARS